ncbi:3-oxoacyl-ACP synthase III family protein [Terrabacter sp. Root181]|uniref:3-oxoacyl-ACP synthase III family protein n=1 Tax=Terrabacter sp. Root181 TaxID=1736484 RepID=UPI0006FFBCDE|nr:3-oxoacyl-[acyl-carrier-protein] synthase III C-terminal domain-containing protein [Terrabacter sp. Root181]KRB48301.1 3-oxoacyl-ACP synthase [Terrabacter sp. Root181]
MSSRLSSRIAGVSAHVAEHALTVEEVEARIVLSSEGFVPPVGVLGRLTGVRRIYHAGPDVQASDLAARAARTSLASLGLDVADVDLIVFASASQDLVEPATAHIVADLLGARCPVMDVKNACNSWLNGVQVAEALIAMEQYERVLVVTGEMPSRAARWSVRDARQFVESVPGYTMSDAGAAALVERAAPGARGEILHRWFTAESRHWSVGQLPAGGTRHPRDVDKGYFVMDGARLRQAFDSVDVEEIDRALKSDGLGVEDFVAVAVHQVAMPYLDVFAARLGLRRDLVVETLPDHGNCASATLPLQWQQIERRGLAEPGRPVLLVGLAGGISVGTMAVRW